MPNAVCIKGTGFASPLETLPEPWAVMFYRGLGNYDVKGSVPEERGGEKGGNANSKGKYRSTLVQRTFYIINT